MKNLIGVVAIIIALGIVTAMTLTRKEPPKNEETTQRIHVTVEKTMPQTIQDTVIAHGQVTPRWETTLASEVDGRVLQVSDALLTGAHFNKGDILAVLDATRYEAALANAQANLETAIRTFKEEQQRSKLAADNWKNSGFKDAPSDLVLRKPQLKEAKAIIVSAERAVKKATYDLTQTKIIAPYDGTVLERNINPGNMLQTGNQIARIYDRTIYEVSVPLNSSEILRLSDKPIGTEVVLSSRHSDKVWQGKVSRIEQAIDEKNRWQNVIVEVMNTNTLLPGMFVTADLPGKSYSNIFSLSEHIPADDGYIWYVDDEDQLQKFNTDILFRKDGKIFFLAPLDLHTPVRITAGRDIYLAGVKVTSSFEMDEQSPDSTGIAGNTP